MQQIFEAEIAMTYIMFQLDIFVGNAIEEWDGCDSGEQSNDFGGASLTVDGNEMIFEVELNEDIDVDVLIDQLSMLSL